MSASYSLPSLLFLSAALFFLVPLGSAWPVAVLRYTPTYMELWYQCDACNNFRRRCTAVCQLDSQEPVLHHGSTVVSGMVTTSFLMLM